MNVTVPQGVVSGQTVQLQTPAGMVKVTVPPNMSPGMTFQIQLGAQQPTPKVHVAQPQLLAITVPHGVVSGQLLQLQTPTGQVVQIRVTPNMKPGMVINVKV